MIYYRFIPKSEILTESDYIRGGIGVDSDHYLRIRRERESLGLNDDKKYSETWDKREGYYITGEKIDTKYHPYHELRLYDTEKDRYMEVDSVVNTMKVAM